MANIGAVTLAAGESSRFGKPKQLIRFRGQTLLERAAAAAVEAGCRPVVIVTGSDADKISGSISGESISCIENPQWAKGIGTSIEVGVRRLLDLTPDTDAVVILACDQPFVTAQTIMNLIGRWRETDKPIVASSYSNTLGVPALFNKSCFDELQRLPPNSGAKPVILLNAERVAAVPFPQGACDIDTVQDKEAAISEKISPTASQPPK